MIPATALLLAVLLTGSSVHQGGEAAGQNGQQPGGLELFEPGAGDDFVAETSIGMRVLLEEIVIPGSELRAVPVADPGKADVLVRVVNVFTHGTDHRYNIEVTPYIEGDIDLRDHLERVDGSSMEDVPELYIYVDAVLPEEALEPNDIEVPHPGSVGGYQALMIGLGVLWVLGLLALIFVGRKKSQAALDAAAERPLTLADRLRPLVEGARTGTIEDGDRAELERMLLAYWRERRDLSGVRIADAVTTLRSDDEAGPLFRKLEEWLHRPAGAGGSDVNVAELLAPYENVPTPIPSARDEHASTAV